jgi:hypothetical protein
VSTPSAALFLSQPGLVSRLQPARHDPLLGWPASVAGCPDLEYTYVWAEDPGESEEHGFRPIGDPVPDWKVVERDG